MKIIWLHKEKINEAVHSQIARTNVVLDIGSGIRPQSFFRPRVHICVEPHLPYLERLQRELSDDLRYLVLNCTWDIGMKILPSRSVDTVFALDFIEHLNKADGLAFLQEAMRVARRQLVVFTPLGFYPQEYEDPLKHDRWGMNGGLWQTHRSGWQVEDFGEGWELICCEAYHFNDQYGQPLEKPVGVIWAFYNLGGSPDIAHGIWHYSWLLRRRIDNMLMGIRFRMKQIFRKGKIGA